MFQVLDDAKVFLADYVAQVALSFVVSKRIKRQLRFWARLMQVGRL